ncbi:unnamed protein product [Gongylonema pulchrum]|uniref:C2H2-type domain-containing protein n=1 Tax=Gongylonema pulchrum TaxID=637853 RepID=A0A183EBX4_9BILA|nr:unnamed protein product [Gongylonema pulchrum]
MHVGKREFACTECSYSTKRAHALEAHQQLHVAEKQDASVVAQEVASNGSAPAPKNNRLLLRRRGEIVGERTGRGLLRIYTCRWCPYQTRLCTELHVHYNYGAGTTHCVARHRLCHASAAESKDAGEVDNSKTEEQSRSNEAGKPKKMEDAENEAEPLRFEESPKTKLAILRQLHDEYQQKKRQREIAEASVPVLQCEECPYSTKNQVLFDLHKDMHERPGGKKRPHACNICSFNVRSPVALQRHLNLHIPAEIRSKFVQFFIVFLVIFLLLSSLFST